MMSRVIEALQRCWWAFELPGYRSHPQRATYTAFDYKGLPPIAEDLEDRFDWLLREQPHEESLTEESMPGEHTAFLESYSVMTASLPQGMHLPETFQTFMQTTALQERIRSCTACYLQLPDRMVRTTGEEEGCLVHFLSDQQGCLHWYLYVNVGGEHCVVVSRKAYGIDYGEVDRSFSGWGSHRPVDLLSEEVWLCAASFSEFIYRFWLENEIWFSLVDKDQPLTPRQKAYLEYYKA